MNSITYSYPNISGDTSNRSMIDGDGSSAESRHCKLVNIMKSITMRKRDNTDEFYTNVVVDGVSILNMSMEEQALYLLLMGIHL